MKSILSLLARVIGYPCPNVLSNIAEGTHDGVITKLADAAITTRYLLVKFGSDVDHIAVLAADDDLPLGPCEDEPAAAEDPVAVPLLGCVPRTVKLVASEAIDYGDEVFAVAGGKVQDTPVAKGTYYRVGRAIQTVTTDGDIVECIPYTPTQYVVT
jgi:hypothetical protein